jgi:hypothetical protein
MAAPKRRKNLANFHPPASADFGSGYELQQISGNGNVPHDFCGGQW